MRKLETLTYTNERGESIIFSHTSKYHVNFKNVSGLSDVRNAIYSINSMGQNGDTYLGNRIEAREVEIVGHLRTRDKAEARRMRRQLNRVLNPQYTATLMYEFDGVRRVIGCTVDNAPVLTREETIFEGFTIQLSCLNPFWREETETREDIAAWIGGFAFEEPDGFEIPAVEGWEIGHRTPSLIVNVYNGGDVATGIRVVFRAMGEVSRPSLLNVNTQKFLKLDIEMAAGDVLTVSTGYGEKRVTLKRAGVESDAFRYLDVDSTYLQLAVGDNIFRYNADDGLENLEVSVYHNNLYLGV